MNLGQFFGVVGTASNIVGQNTSTYTKDMFIEDFPQFSKEEKSDDDPPVTTRVSLIPENMFSQFITMANAAIQEARWFDKWRFAMGLFIAHYATLYLRAFSENSSSTTDAADSGAVLGIVNSASLGDASVTFDTKAVMAATEKWGAWNSTTYGQLLVTEARLVGMGGAFII